MLHRFPFHSKEKLKKTLVYTSEQIPKYQGGDENAGVEKWGADSRGGKCRSGKCGSR